MEDTKWIILLYGAAFQKKLITFFDNINLFLLTSDYFSSNTNFFLNIV